MIIKKWAFNKKTIKINKKSDKIPKVEAYLILEIVFSLYKGNNTIIVIK